jgi:hypothetical protein
MKNEACHAIDAAMMPAIGPATLPSEFAMRCRPKTRGCDFLG